MNLGNFSDVVLLTGAGFSANWQGFLSSEFFDRLLGHPEISSNKTLRPLVLEHTNFEEVVFEARKRGLPADLVQLFRYRFP